MKIKLVEFPTGFVNRKEKITSFEVILISTENLGIFSKFILTKSMVEKKDGINYKFRIIPLKDKSRFISLRAQIIRRDLKNSFSFIISNQNNAKSIFLIKKYGKGKFKITKTIPEILELVLKKYKLFSIIKT